MTLVPISHDNTSKGLSTIHGICKNIQCIIDIIIVRNIDKFKLYYSILVIHYGSVTIIIFPPEFLPSQMTS